MISFRLTLLLALATCGFNVAAQDYDDARELDPRSDYAMVLRDSLRVVPMTSSLSLAIVPFQSADTSAVAAHLLSGARVTQTFLAADLIPEGFQLAGTIGQIYSGATSRDERRMALSLGWTNAAGRNVNGIAFLTRNDGRWRADHVVLLRGSVRDVAVLPDGDRIVAVTADAAERVPATRLVLLDFSGRILGRKTLYEGEAAEEVALATRIQVIGSSDLALFRVDDSAGRLLRLRQSSTCTGTVRRRDDGFFHYPEIGKQCYETEVVRLLSFAGLPKEAEHLRNVAIQAVALNDDGSIAVVRTGFDGQRALALTSTYGRPAVAATKTHTAVWRGIRITGGQVRALDVQPDGVVEITVQVP